MDGDTGFQERLLVAVASGLRRLHLQLAVDEADAPVPVRDQVGHRLARTLTVLDIDGDHVQEVGMPADQDHRPAVFDEQRQDRIVDVAREHDHPVEVAAAQDAVVEAGLHVGGEHGEHDEVALLRAGLEQRLDHAGDERVGEAEGGAARDEQADRVGA